MTDYLGDDGDDEFSLSSTDGDSTVDGSGGTDTLNVDWSTEVASIYLYYFEGSGEALGGSSSLAFTNIEMLDFISGSGHDSFESGGDATIDGGAGNDEFISFGTDVLIGGPGNDFFSPRGWPRSMAGRTMIHGLRVTTKALILFR